MNAIAADPAARGEFVAQAYARIRDLIVRGELAPGTRLIEVDVAARLGMSRTPVRTAFHMLQQEGYVAAPADGRQSRLTVAPLTQDDAAEIFGIVGELEGLAARWAAALPRAPRAALARTLTALNTSMQRATAGAAPDPEATIRADNAFHRAYVEAPARPRLAAFHATIKPHADRYIYLYHSTLTTQLPTSTREHAVIVRAVAAGDAEAAQRAVETNWANAAARLSASIANSGERGRW